jgi:hypothetical protein
MKMRQSSLNLLIHLLNVNGRREDQVEAPGVSFEVPQA